MSKETKKRPETAFEFLVNATLAAEKLRIAAQNRNTHLAKQDKEDPTTQKIYNDIKGLEDFIDGELVTKVEAHPASYWFSKVKGVGGENIAKVLGSIRIKPDPDDPKKGYAKSVSGLWKFAGFSVENGKSSTPKKGKKNPYNKTLRTMCWRLASSLMRARGKYYEYFTNQKDRYKARFIRDGYNIIPASELPVDERDKHYEPEGVISEGHVMNMALRKMIKLFLSHLWVVWREIENLPISKPYAQEKLGHDSYMNPWDFVDK